MEENIIIWGTGRLLQAYQKYINLKKIIYFVDSDLKKQNTEILGKMIIAPERLRDVEYGFLIIFVAEKYDEIYQKAVDELNIPKEKIWYWSNFYSYSGSMQIMNYMLDNCNMKGYCSILDYGLHMRESLCIGHQVSIYGLNSDKKKIYPVYRNIYNEIYESIEGIPYNIFHGVAYLGKFEDIHMLDKHKKQIKQLINEFKGVYFLIPYPDTKENRELYNMIRNLANKEMIIEESNHTCEKLIYVSASYKKSLKIYIATHKYFDRPKLEEYVPLWLGRKEDNLWEFINADSEINELNPLINECTGLYWLWKHVTSDYIGLVHYRRYFIQKSDSECKELLTQEKITKLLEKYDIIVAAKSCTIVSVEKRLKMTIEPKAFSEGLKIIRLCIEKYQSEYLEAFEMVMQGSTMFPCSMMITRKSIFNQYCEWLFSIILEATKQIDVSEYEDYSKRVLGFFAERLFTVWLMKQTLKIKEMPIWVTEKVEDRNTDISRL